MNHFPDITPRQLEAALTAIGEPGYRAAQILQWVYRKGVCDYSAMTDLPADLANRLAERLEILTGRIVARSDSPDGVVKLLIEWRDSQCIESVLIPSPSRVTACLSTQVGCAVACGFCASGMDGMQRNLSCGEIIEQLLHLRSVAESRITNVVFMGVGEPLANYANTVSAVRAIIDPERLGISARHVTVSTIGLAKQIRRLGKEGLPITLAISLHAPNDALRRQLIPGAAKTTIAEIVAAAREFYQACKREITLEYVLLKGVNDTKLCADGLARIAAQLRCNVNLIRYNPVPSLPYEAPSQGVAKAFAQRLRKCGVNAHVRRPRGCSANAACGQLRSQRTEPR